MTITIINMAYRVFFTYKKHISETDHSVVKICKEHIDINYRRLESTLMCDNDVLKFAHEKVDRHLCYLDNTITFIQYLGCTKEEYELA